jgi:hypothetical protein
MSKPTKRRAALANPPQYTRFAKTAGAEKIRVDRTGGKFGAGVIYGVSVITKGEALGHYAWCDDVFLDQVNEAGVEISASSGLKSRFTHPDMSSDGMGKMTSRLFDFRREGDQVYADQHFLKSAHDAPDGDLAGYLMNLAEEDPAGYGLSIVFSQDFGEGDRFRAEHTDEDGVFTSPDPDNTNNYWHVRLSELYAADSVDEPAANPNGLFAREKDLANEASQLAAFALGLSTDRPTTVQLGLDPDRLRGFATRFLKSHNLEITPMKTKLNAASNNPTNDQPAGDETKPAEGGTTNSGEGTKPAESGTTEAGEGSAEPPAADPAPVAASAKNEANKFKAAFGAKGFEYLCEGLSFAEAQARFNSDSIGSVEERLAKLETQLAAGQQISGEAKPAGFQAPPAGEKKKGFASKFRFSAVAKENPAQK